MPPIQGEGAALRRSKAGDGTLRAFRGRTLDEKRHRCAALQDASRLLCAGAQVLASTHNGVENSDSESLNELINHHISHQPPLIFAKNS